MKRRDILGTTVASLKKLLKILQIFTNQAFAYPFQREGKEGKETEKGPKQGSPAALSLL